LGSPVGSYSLRTNCTSGWHPLANAAVADGNLAGRGACLSLGYIRTDARLGRYLGSSIMNMFYDACSFFASQDIPPPTLDVQLTR
jgi:hypothetical protein